MKTRTFILPFLLLIFFAQCKKASEPLGYYYITDECFKPSYVFYYNDCIHHSRSFYVTDTSESWTDSIVDIFRQRKNVYSFFDGDICVDTLQFTNYFQSNNVFQYHFIYTPLTCKFYVYKPSQLVGTYEFVPTQTERGLISFAVSRLDLGDTPVKFNSFKKQPNDIIIEDAFFSLLIKSDELNIDIVAPLYADEVPDDIFFLSDILNALVNDYCKLAYVTSEKPCEKVLETFEKRIYE